MRQFNKVHAFFYKQYFYEQHQAEIGKNLSKSRETPWDRTFEILNLFSFLIHIFIILLLVRKKKIVHVLKNVQKDEWVYFDDIIWLIEIKMTKKNRSHRHDMNRPRSRQCHKILNIENITVWWCFYILSYK